MPLHWTYEDVPESSALEQGDILRPTDQLREVFSMVHPHFCDDKYLGFIVATQSCDLVPRGGFPKAAYVNISTIRPLSQVIHKLIEHVAVPIGPQAFRSSAKGDVRRLLERLLNQNEQALGLFFLYPDADAGVAELSVAVLRVSIAVRREHYRVLQESRVGRLRPEFQAKLGWLIGNLYGRPATPDWADTVEGKKRFNEIVKQYMNEARWFDDKVVEAAMQRGIDVATASQQTLESLREKPPIERALDEVGVQIARVDGRVSSDTIEKVCNRLRNSGKFSKLFES